ncbi:MAG: Calx-beta domain-containing protein, partial [Planctomycetota bacterium]
VSEAATVDWEVDTVGVANPVDADDFLGGVLPSGQANFPAGESTTQVVITVNPDFSFEADEEFRLTLTGAGGNGTVVVSDENDAFGMIINDDAAFSVNPGPQFRLRQQDSSGSDFDNWGIDNVSHTGGLVSDDFDPDIDLTQWGSVELGETNSNFGGTGNSLFFTGSGQRAITTNPLNAVSGDVLSFDFIYGDDNNGGENPEDGEEVVLEYSLDTGQSWTFINQYDLNVTSWTTMNEPAPAGAIRDPEAADEGISISFDVVRFGVDTNAVESMVPWEVVGSGSAPADAADFPGGVLPSGVLHFAAGEITKSITIDVLDDGLFEADETFDLVVGGIGSGFLATGTILNNDSMPNGDFDGDGDYDCDDIDGLVENIVNQTNVATYDMDGNATLDTADLDEWLAVAGNVNLPSGNPYLVGDANLDGIVDGQDFLAWNDSKFTSGNGWCGGDFNADGITDGQDYLLWNNNKFTSSATVAPLAPATPSLPEEAAQRIVVSPPAMAPVPAPLHVGILYQAAPPALRVSETDAAFADLEADQDESDQEDRWEHPWAELR